MTAQLTRPGPSELLLGRVAKRLEEAAQLREQFGDPTEALHAFVRENFDPDALLQTYLEFMDSPNDDEPGMNDRGISG